MIDQKFHVVFSISPPANNPKKWFSTQNEPLDVRLKMRLTPTMEASDLLRNQAKTMMQSFKNTLKDCTVVSVYFCQK